MQKIAVICGGNRGIGLETCRQLFRSGMTVILTARNEERGKTALNTLKSEGIDALFYALDVDDQQQIENFRSFLAEQFKHLDVLVNDAGVFSHKNILEGDIQELEEIININLFGVIRLTTALIPLLKKSNDARIINVSTGMASIHDLNGKNGAYRLSKAALNAYTIMLSKELFGTSVKVNAVCPGWVFVEIGEIEATRTDEQGADTITWLATLPDAPTGRFYRDRKEINF